MMKKRLTISIVILCVVSVTAQADFAATPYIAGEFNGWDAGGNPMAETVPGSGIWEYTIIGLIAGQRQEFKITQGNWDSNFPPQNSWYTAGASGTVTVTFNANSVSDGWLPVQYRLSLNTDPGSWSLVGDYNGWNNADPTQLMTSLGNGIYAITRTFAAGSHNLKPVKTGSWDGIGPIRGRCMDADNYNLSLASATEVTVYVNAYAGTMGFGGEVDLSGLLDIAYDPNPKNGAVVGTDFVTALSWTNPDPNNPADAITCDVYFLDAGPIKLTEDPNMGPTVIDPGVVQIADDITDATVVLPGSVLPLQDDHYYYWAVHATDPHGDPNGNPLTTQGIIWYFFTGDSAPVPGQPVDQYMWLSQDDSAIGGIGDTNPNVRYFQVTASYTDDGKSPIVDANLVNLNWDWANGELGIVKVSEIHDPVAKTVTAVYRTIYEEDGDPSNTTVLPGYWEIRLEVTDGTGTAYGNPGIHRIFETCGEAAAADPDDPYDGYYDINNDCIVSLPDFAEFAAKWLYQGIKYE
jgi:hypothetical protein